MIYNNQSSLLLKKLLYLHPKKARIAAKYVLFHARYMIMRTTKKLQRRRSIAKMLLETNNEEKNGEDEKKRQYLHIQ